MGYYFVIPQVEGNNPKRLNFKKDKLQRFIMEEYICNLFGESLGLSKATYNNSRRPEAVSEFKTLCHAPFVSMDFGPQGQINVCNHYGKIIGHIKDSVAIEDIWFGNGYEELRQNMLKYWIDEDLCRHCSKQIRTGKPENSFSVEQYDCHPATTGTPGSPTLITFRLSNKCNLACIMCAGDLSSRIRREREHRKEFKSPYNKKFFEDMRMLLPKVRHVEFFGGEPFLSEEHLKIFEIIKETNSICSIYVNTNGTVLTGKIKDYLRSLNFTCIAISMDALSPEVLGKIRIGIDYDRFMQNLDWYLKLRESKHVTIVLNVTELRQNWFELPEMFRFAASKDIHLHINTCIHPPHCTIYDLPTDQVIYVRDFLMEAKEGLGEDLAVRDNMRSYDHLLAMIEKELDSRDGVTDSKDPPALDMAMFGTSGQLAAPIGGVAPFETPEKLLIEVSRLEKEVPGFGQRILSEMRNIFTIHFLK